MIGIGHSQGGGTAWKLDESAFVRDDPAYLGTVALAPGTYIIETLFSDLDKLVAHPTYLPFIPEAVERTYPHYHETLLSETLRQRVALAKENQLCRAGMAGLMADLKGSFDGLVSVQGIERDLPTLLDWQNSMAPARGDRSPAPIFVLQGLNDTAVYAWATIKAVQHIFESGNEIHLALYPDVEHTPLLQVFELDWMGWIDSRFEAGKPKGSGKCSRVVRKAYNGKYVKLPAQR